MNIGEYNTKSASSFTQFLDLSTNEVTLLADKYYCIDISKASNEAISPTDVTDDTIVFTHTDYTDKTLTMSDKAADAKATGDAIGMLDNNIATINTANITWALNGINVSTGANTTATNRVSSDLVTNCPSIVHIAEGYSYMIMRYTKDGTYDGAFDGSTWGKSYKAAMWRTVVLTIDELGSNAGNYNYRVAMKENNDADLTIADASHITLLAFTDSALTMSGKAADAKVVGTDVKYIGLSDPYNITWQLNKNLSNGEETASTFTALSNALPPSPIIVRTGADQDSNDKYLSMFVHEFRSDDSWIGRTRMDYTTSRIMRVSDECAYIRIVFGRASSYAVNIAQSDIDTYFGVEMYVPMRYVMSELDKIGAQTLYTAMMTDTVIGGN
jgi:hypothetical protein